MKRICSLTLAVLLGALRIRVPVLVTLLVLAGIVAGEAPAFAQNMFTKSFGATSIPLNGTTSLTFHVGYVNGSNTTDFFTDTLPAGLVVASPNGFTGVTGIGSCTASTTIVTATAGSSSEREQC